MGKPVRSVVSGILLSVVVTATASCVPRREPLPAYTPPAPITRDVPAGAHIGYIQAMFKGSEWLTPPPVVGEIVMLVFPQVTKSFGNYLLDGVGDAGQLRVLDVKEYGRTVLPDGTTTVTFEIVYRKETIQINIPYEITNTPEQTQ